MKLVEKYVVVVLCKEIRNDTSDGTHVFDWICFHLEVDPATLNQNCNHTMKHAISVPRTKDDIVIIMLQVILPLIVFLHEAPSPTRYSEQLL